MNQERQKLANLLFAGGSLTVAAVLANLQMQSEPVTLGDWPSTSQVLSETVRIETPELPKVQETRPAPLAKREIFYHPEDSETEPTTRGRFSSRVLESYEPAPLFQGGRHDPVVFLRTEPGPHREGQELSPPPPSSQSD